MNNEILVFSEDTKSAVIDIKTLDRTIKLEEANGKMPATAPMEHVELINTLVSEASARLKSKAAIMPITIKQANCKRIMWKGEKDKCPVENYLIERVALKIKLDDKIIFPDRLSANGGMQIGVIYSEKGIQVALGHNVSVCDNLNIFGENMFSTFGPEKISLEKGLKLVDNWLTNYEKERERAEKLITAMINRIVTLEERQRVFGKLYEMAVYRNNGSTDINPPLNITECNRMISNGMEVVKSQGEISVWDITNWSTAVLKPDVADMPVMLHKNKLVNKFLLDEFNLN